MDRSWIDTSGQPAAYLSRCDKRMGEAVRRIGALRREANPDLFCALVESILSQQIAMRAAAAVTRRLTDRCGGRITVPAILALDADRLRECGLSARKATCIRSAAEAFAQGRIDPHRLRELPDEEVCRRLTELKGVGRWTAEMLLIFSLQRPDVMSFGDLGIRRGLCLLHRHKELDAQRFERYRKRYSPFGSAASLYLWEIAGAGGLPERAVATED